MRSRPAIPHTEASLDGKSLPSEVQQEILRAIAGIDYGSVEVVIHDAKVIQIVSEQLPADRIFFIQKSRSTYGVMNGGYT